LFDEPPEDVWKVVADPDPPPIPWLDVSVEQRGSKDGTGEVLVTKFGLVTIHEERTRVDDDDYVLDYRLTKGAPVRDYVGRVTLEDSPPNCTRLIWSVSFTPIVPETGCAITHVAKLVLNHVLDAVAAELRRRRHERGTP
jgi:hypothetical protein